MAVAKRYVPNKALKKKNGYCLDTKSPATNKQSRDTKELSKFVSEKQRAQKKPIKKKGSQENAVEKMQKEVQCPIYSRTAPRKGKPTAMLSLKRHIA